MRGVEAGVRAGEHREDENINNTILFPCQQL